MTQVCPLRRRMIEDMTHQDSFGVTVATRTGAAKLGVTSAPPDLLAAAKTAPGVTGGTSLQDDTVTAGKSIATTCIDRASGSTLHLPNTTTIDASALSNVNVSLAGMMTTSGEYASANLTITKMTGAKTLNDVTGVFTDGAELYDAISVNGTFSTAGYFDNGTARAANIIVEITGETGTQAATTFML